MKLLFVNYHYIGDEAQYARGIYPISSERLSKQIDNLAHRFAFISGEQLVRAIRGELVLPEYACIITLDDGLRCQRLALDVFEEKKVPAIFFVPTMPVIERRPLLVHQIHLLLAELEPGRFTNLILDQLSAKKISHTSLDELAEIATKKYRYDSKEVAALKYLLNAKLDYVVRHEVIEEIFKNHYDSETFVEDWYLNESEIADLGKRGWLGMHSHDHSPLIGDRAQIEENLRRNKQVLESISSADIYAISYPYGSPLDISPELPKICTGLGLTFGLTMERAFNTSLNEPFFLARADTNDVPGGKHPCFNIFDGHEIEITSVSFGKNRSLFCSD